MKQMIATAARYEQQSGFEELSAQLELRYSADKLVNRRKYKKRVKSRRKKLLREFLTNYPHMPTIREEDEIFDFDQQSGDSDSDFTSCSDISFLGDATRASFENDIFGSIEELLVANGLPNARKLVAEVESCYFLFGVLRECTTTHGFVCAVGQYVRNHTDQSIAFTIFEYLKTVFEVSFHEQSGEEIDTSKPAWLDSIKTAMTDWKSFRTAYGFKQINQLLSLCVALGFCEATSVTFSVAGMKMFAPNVEVVQRDSDCMITAMMDTVLYFVEGGYSFFSKGDVSTLMYGKEAEMETEYFELIRLSAFARTGDLEKRANMDEKFFRKRVDSMLIKLRHMYASATNNWDKKVIFDRRRVIEQISTDLVQRSLEGGLREAPFVVVVSGRSSQGKSAVADLGITTVLKSNGYPYSKEYIHTLADGEKHMDGMKTHVSCIRIDDFNNTKEKYMEQAPTRLIIDLCNNVRIHAKMADLAEKGKVSVEPRMVSITTNDPTLGADNFSHEPVSIMRRGHVHVSVSIKNEYSTVDNNGILTKMLDTAKVWKEFNKEPKTVQDIWNISVNRIAAKPPGGAHVAGIPDAWAFEPMIFEGKPLVNISCAEYLRFLRIESAKYYAEQRAFVEKSNKMEEELTFCQECDYPCEYCQCFKKQIGFEDMRTWIVFYQIKVLRLLNFPYLYLFDYVPDFVTLFISSRFVRSTFFRDELLVLFVTFLAYLSSFFYIACVSWELSFLIFLFSTTAVYGIVLCCKLSLEQKFLHTRDAFRLTYQRIVRNRMISFFGGITIVLATIAVCKTVRALYSFKSQTWLNPTEEEIKVRDAAPSDWANVSITPVPGSDKSKSTDWERLQKTVAKNLCYVRVHTTKGTQVCNALFIESNLAIIPNHFWEECEGVEAQFIKNDVTTIGSTFKCRLSRDHSVKFPDTDLSLVWVPNGGSWKSIKEYLPVDTIAQRSLAARLSYRCKDGTIETATARLKYGVVKTSAAQFYGAEYSDLSINTRPGLCMGTFVSESKPPVICGFHLGGIAGKSRGCCGTLTLDQVRFAIFLIRQLDVLPSMSEGVMPTELYGKQILKTTEVHPKSIVNFMTPDNHFEVYGMTDARTNMVSGVIPTVISDAVAEVFEQPNIWGAPKFKPEKKCFREALLHSSNNNAGFELELLSAAKTDWVEPLLAKIKGGSWISAKPLTDVETVSGIDGRKFIDSMKMSTSVGFPLGGPKSDHVIFLDPENYPDHNEPRTLNPIFFDRMREMERAWCYGKRAYPIFKGSLKDEPTKLSKDKVRVFQASPIELQLAVRKYYLPIMRFLSMHPQLSECSVGINAQGPEWHELAMHVTSFGEDRIFAGDHSKYDLEMKPSEMFLAFKAIIELAEECDYDQIDLQIMRGIATEICYPTMSYDGTLVQLNGSNPSGQNLTVYINCIVNSFLMRCVYFRKYTLCAVPFRTNVALMTYGDDVVGSVSKDADDFNIITTIEELARVGKKFTMPDKESVALKFLTIDSVDFLKRKFRFEPEVEMYFAPLDDMSILKSLHSVIGTAALSKEELAGCNIDGAMREWFFHGEAIYESNRKKLQIVAAKCGIEHHCAELHTSYAERMVQWKKKYLEQDAQSFISE
jgi:hypothetical protein